MAETKTAPEDQQDDIPVSERKPYKDVDGNVIDAPVIPEFERRTQDAQNRADQDEINEIAEEYHKARDEKVKRDNQREKDRRKEANK